jgi:two-component system response regulator LytT
MQPIRILTADDEAPARAELRYILELFWPEAVFIEASDGRQALTLVQAAPVDVAFLDIQMPELDGLSTAAALLKTPAPPLIIFATAYDQHALRAFDLAALDYVVKPFDERRLAQTAARIRQTLGERSLLDQQHALLQRYLQEHLPMPGLVKLWGERENETRVLVDPQDVRWIEAGQGRVSLVTARGERLLLRQPLKELEPQLAPHHIVRVHKGYLVNLNHVAEVVPWFSGGYLMRLDDGATEIPVSRRYAAELKKGIGLY